MVRRMGQLCFAEIIFTVSLLFAGTFHEYVACVLAATMLIWLVIKIIKEKSLPIYLNLTSLSIGCLVLFYALSVFWAVDRGMAFIGFLKFLPLPLYLLVLMQQKAEGIMAKLPYIAAGMAILSVVGMQIPVLESFFSVSGRLAGFFQYPNTFALFLLVAELVIVAKEKHRGVDIAVMVVLLAALLYTGSRTVFVLTLLSNAVLLFTGGHRKVKIGVFVGVVLAVIGMAAYLMASGKMGVFSRFLTISVTESTFVGRLLYFQDALPLILRHPFGLGYMGYYYMQQAMQTGVYSVMFIHNDFLQMLLDVGWVPFALFAAAVLKSVFGGKKPLYKRVILCVIAMHSCFDFNLQFIAMFFLLLLFMDHRTGREYSLTKRGTFAVLGAGLTAVCLYGCVGLALSRFGKYKTAQMMYPWNTQNEIQLLVTEENISVANDLADDILGRNEYVTLAYSVKARHAYAQGDFAGLIAQKRKIFDKAPFAYEEYEEYAYMLINGIAIYSREGDSDSARICEEELITVGNYVHSVQDRLSQLGTMIDDQPTTRLPEDVEKYIARLERTRNK